MRIRHPALCRALGLLAGCGVRLLRRTVDWKAVYFDPAVDIVHPHHAGRYVYAGWHEYLLMPAALRGDARMVALASGHADGDVASHALRQLGWGIARGSSSRGGAAALLRLLRDDARNPSLTPDGPRGPRRQLAPGPLYLASRLGLPLVCLGYGYDRPWRFRSWDRFALPRPFSRARAVFGPPLRLPPRLGRAGLESYRQWFEGLLNWLTEEAEGWAASGARRDGEVRMLPGRWGGKAPPEETSPALALPAGLSSAWAELEVRARSASVAGGPAPAPGD